MRLSAKDRAVTLEALRDGLRRNDTMCKQVMLLRILPNRCSIFRVDRADFCKSFPYLN